MALIQQTSTPENRVEAEVILKYMNRMMENNKNYLACVTGATGSGKSYSCLRLAELWYKFYFDKPFPIENICFSVEDLVNRLRDGNLKRGDLLIAEEIGVGANAKNFQSNINKALQFILQSFRSMNIIVLFNVPHFSFFDKTARMLMHSHFQTTKIDRANDVCILKPYFLSVSQQTGKIYTKWLRIVKNNRKVKIKRLNLSKPSSELAKRYEVMKNNYVKTLITDMGRKITAPTTTSRKELTQRQADVFKYLQQGLGTGEIARILKLSDATISQNKGWLRKKGYMWDESQKFNPIVNIKVKKDKITHQIRGGGRF